MARLAANLTMLFTELPFLDRFAAAADAGFSAVEFLFPYDHPPEVLARRREAAGVEVVLFNLPPGDWAAGDRGLAALPDRVDEFARSLPLALDYAEALSCPTLHAMAGVLPASTRSGGAAPAWISVRPVYLDNLRRAAAALATAGRTLAIEPLNDRDMPGYVLRTTTGAAALIAEAGCPNLGLQLDLYHCQIMEGDLTTRIRRLAPLLRHVQIAGVPDRHEPDLGECNPYHLLAELDAQGYAAWVGCEYRPRDGTLKGLSWARGYLSAP
jgi:hydroxypyruvate isomerase